MTERAQLVQQAPQCPNIALFVIGLLLTELGGKVERRPHHRLRELVTGEHLGDAEVSDLHFLILIHEDVEGLYIPVQDLIPVYVLQSHANLNKKFPNALLLQRFSILRLEEIRQVPTVAKLHDDVERILLDEGLSISHDEGVEQLAHDGRLVDRLPYNRETFLRAF